jgi:arylsulfatase A-like enzyme
MERKEMSDSKRNILLFHVDQLRSDVCGLYGSRLGLTPNLDCFAKQGCTFLSHCAVNPVCTPNRAALFTGQYSTTNGIWRNGMGLQPDQPTLVHNLAEAGYETSYIGKWHLAGHHSELPEGHRYEDYAAWCESHPDYYGPVPEPFRGGFQRWLAAEAPDLTDDPWATVLWDEKNQPQHFPGHRIDAYTDCAIRYLQEKREKPFFLCVSYLEPHQQNHENWYAAEPALEEFYRNAALPDELDALKHLGPEIRSKFPGYCANVRKLDEAFGRLLGALKSLGLAENTLVMFTTDHGDHFHTRVKNDDNKRTCHDVSVRIPCVMRGGPFRNGLRVKALTSTLDVLPTVFDVVGVATPETAQGKSLAELTGNGLTEDRESALMQIWGTEGPERALRTDRYKICARLPNADWWYDFAGPEYQVTELYDLRSDPYELENKVNQPQYRAIQEELTKHLAKAMHDAGENDFSIRGHERRID